MNAFIWAVLCAVVWGIVPLVEKLGLVKIDPMVGLFYRCLGVIVGIVLLFAFKYTAIKQSFGQLHNGMLFLILGGFMASVIGQVCFYNALKTGEMSKVVPIAATYPLVAFALGVLFLGEKVTWAKTGGIFFVLLGVLLLK